MKLLLVVEYYLQFLHNRIIRDHNFPYHQQEIHLNMYSGHIRKVRTLIMNHLIIFDVTNCERKVGVNDTGMLTCTGFREKKKNSFFMMCSRMYLFNASYITSCIQQVYIYNLMYVKRRPLHGILP